MSNGPKISHDTAVTKLQDALRLRVGRAGIRVQSLSDATGIKPRTIESYLQGGATPGLNGFLTLCGALGPSFATDVLSACGMTVKSADPDAPEHFRVLAALGELTHDIAEAVSDGHVDHREAAQLRPLAQGLIEALEPLARDTTTIPFRGEVRAR